ncbi:transposase [Streptomyces sp. NPDC005989]|uniref:transposase n=1 Tax=Streptomyces sp. NPDC005989 TaxID=3156727 RepID=UPI0033F105DE
MTVAKDTLLRLVRAAPPKEPGPVRVLGVDELALIKGHTYVTILVDLEARQPIDALPGREADPVARRPAGHPAVEIVCRDRATAYAEAARRAVKRVRAKAGDAPSRVAAPESGTGPAPGLSQISERPGSETACTASNSRLAWRRAGASAASDRSADSGAAGSDSGTAADRQPRWTAATSETRFDSPCQR